MTIASPRAKMPSTWMTPAGSRLLPLRKAATAPASMVKTPLGSSEPAIHFLRAVTGFAGGGKPGAARAPRNRLEGMCDAARCDHHVRAGMGRDLAGLDLGLHAAARESRAGRARHCFDRGRDALHQRHQLGLGIACR